MKQFHTWNWRNKMARLMFLAAMVDLFMPGLSQATTDVPIPEPTTLLLLGVGLLGLGFAGRRSKK